MRTIPLRHLMVGAAIVATSAITVGCGDDDGTGGAGMGASGGTGGSGATGGTGGSGATGGTGGSGATGGTGGSGATGGTGGAGTGGSCDADQETEVTANITTDTTWDCGTYILMQKTFITNDATLTIEPGVRVIGDPDVQGDTTALFATRGSKLNAVGTAENPIVFTSGVPEGARGPGDWGGVILLGRAPINNGACVGGTGDACTGGYFEVNIEGIDPTDPNGSYGGDEPEDSCGHIEYARIEFAGFVLGADNELNGLTLGGCGRGTKLSHIQVHMGKDDGIEFFGGTAHIDHAVVTGASDDSLDWDNGWDGNGQFIIIHQLPNDGDKGIEADNLGGNETGTPRSNPTLYNVTMIGRAGTTGMHLREGTRGTLRNFIVTGFQAGVNTSAVTNDLASEWPTHFSIEHSIFFETGPAGNPDAVEDDDLGFNENDAITNAARNNIVDSVDPELGTDITAPNYKPGNTAVGNKATPPAGFDTTADYAGAVDPEGDDWTLGWTSYPVN